jgi:RimJ/RimL family protein N-acetyltransferase
MRSNIIYDQSQVVSEWIKSRLEAGQEFGPTTAIGLERDGALIAGVMYDMYTRANINMHVAAEETHYWISKAYLRACFGYPFHQLRCNRITALVGQTNDKSIRLIEHLGFKKEGVIRMANADGTDTILFGMLRNECRWLEI